MYAGTKSDQDQDPRITNSAKNYHKAKQHTVKLCSNYNSVAVTEKTVNCKRVSVITNVFFSLNCI